MRQVYAVSLCVAVLAQPRKAPFTWKEDGPTARIILALGSCQRDMFSAVSLHAKGCICPSARIILSERKDDPSARRILASCDLPCASEILALKPILTLYL